MHQVPVEKSVLCHRGRWEEAGRDVCRSGQRWSFSSWETGHTAVWLHLRKTPNRFFFCCCFFFIFWCDEAKCLTWIAAALSNESQIVPAEARGCQRLRAHIFEGHFWAPGSWKRITNSSLSEKSCTFPPPLNLSYPPDKYAVFPENFESASTRSVPVFFPPPPWEKRVHTHIQNANDALFQSARIAWIISRVIGCFRAFFFFFNFP